MKIAVATGKGGLDDEVSVVFGRCETYTIVECENNSIKDFSVEPNPSAGVGGGAGVKAAQFVGSKGVEAVIAGNFGPNATAILTQVGVKMVQGKGKVKDEVEKYLNGELNVVGDSTVKGHFGMYRRRGGRGQ